MKLDRKWKKILLLSLKIALGSSLSIYVAELLHVQYAASAGIVALLTLIATRKGTARIALTRVMSFVIMVGVGLATFLTIRSDWLAFGVYILLMVGICEAMDWRATISVNAVIGTHMLMAESFSAAFFLNEFLLVLIGNTFAFLLNMIHDNAGQEEDMIGNIRFVEERMQYILGEVANYLSGNEMTEKVSVWVRMEELEKNLHHYVTEAYEYRENSFRDGADYYADYFEMRSEQLSIVYNLHSEMHKIREIPAQAAVVAEFAEYLKGYVREMNVPTPQMEQLQRLFDVMKKEPLPKSRTEFENRAVLYHIMMDMEEFLEAKAKFVKKHGSGRPE